MATVCCEGKVLTGKYRVFFYWYRPKKDLVLDPEEILTLRTFSMGFTMLSDNLCGTSKSTPCIKNRHFLLWMASLIGLDNMSLVHLKLFLICVVLNLCRDSLFNEIFYYVCTFSPSTEYIHPNRLQLCSFWCRRFTLNLRSFLEKVIIIAQTIICLLFDIAVQNSCPTLIWTIGHASPSNTIALACCVTSKSWHHFDKD